MGGEPVVNFRRALAAKIPRTSRDDLVRLFGHRRRPGLEMLRAASALALPVNVLDGTLDLVGLERAPAILRSPVQGPDLFFVVKIPVHAPSRLGQPWVHAVR